MIETRREIQELINRAADHSAHVADEQSNIRRSHQRDALVLVILLFLVTFVASFAYPFSVDGTPDIRLSMPREFQPGVDPNTANWAELALLPGIGEGMARRIIEYREARQATMPRLNQNSSPESYTQPVFARPNDLLHVRGIGEKTVRRVSPYLRFSAAES